MTNTKNFDFSKMMFNIHGKSEYVCNLYAEFSKPPFLPTDGIKASNIDSWIRYVIYCYDPNTPLVRILDLNERKDLAMVLSKSGNVRGNTVVSKMVAAFMRMVNNREWVQRVAFEQAFYTFSENCMADIPESIDPEKRKISLDAISVAAKYCKEISLQIKEIDQQLSKNNSDILETTLQEEKFNVKPIERLAKDKKHFE